MFIATGFHCLWAHPVNKTRKSSSTPKWYVHFEFPFSSFWWIIKWIGGFSAVCDFFAMSLWMFLHLSLLTVGSHYFLQSSIVSYAFRQLFFNNFGFRKHFVFPCPSILPLFSILFIFFSFETGFPSEPRTGYIPVRPWTCNCLFASQFLGLQSCAYNLVPEKVAVTFSPHTGFYLLVFAQFYR